MTAFAIKTTTGNRALMARAWSIRDACLIAVTLADDRKFDVDIYIRTETAGKYRTVRVRSKANYDFGTFNQRVRAYALRVVETDGT